MTAASDQRCALEAAIHRAYALGRVDVSIEVAAKLLRDRVADQPGVTPGYILRLIGEPARWYEPEWDEALWRLADYFCELQGRQATPRPASPYTVLHYAIPAREAAATQR